MFIPSEIFNPWQNGSMAALFLQMEILCAAFWTPFLKTQRETWKTCRSRHKSTAVGFEQWGCSNRLILCFSATAALLNQSFLLWSRYFILQVILRSRLKVIHKSVSSFKHWKPGIQRLRFKAETKSGSINRGSLYGVVHKCICLHLTAHGAMLVHSISTMDWQWTTHIPPDTVCKYSNMFIFFQKYQKVLQA